MPTSRLICLSQAYVNMECLGLKYPEKLMEEVAKLSVGIEKPALMCKMDEIIGDDEEQQQQQQDYYNRSSNHNSNDWPRNFGHQQGRHRSDQDLSWRQHEANNQQHSQGFHQQPFQNQHQQMPYQTRGNYRSPRFNNSNNQYNPRQGYQGGRGFNDQPRQQNFRPRNDFFHQQRRGPYQRR